MSGRGATIEKSNADGNGEEFTEAKSTLGTG